MESASPEVYAFLETEDYRYMIRLPANAVLQRRIAHLPPKAGQRAVNLRVLREHRYEVGDPDVACKPGERGDADVHHALGF